MKVPVEKGEALELLRSDPATTGIFCDFDGTLSAIVDRPEDAQPLPGAVDVLEKLAGRFAVVGVISGRSLEDLRGRFAPRGVILSGSYGREGAGPRDDALDDWGSIAREAEDAVAGLDGVVVERKEAGVAIHYRLGPQHEDVVVRIAGAIAATHGLEVSRGRKVAELIASGPAKAERLRALVSEHDLGAFLFAGDDAADVEAFAWARGSRKRHVLVGIDSPEAPNGLSTADLLVDGPRAFVELLEALVKRPG